ncbi:hypothetical protein [Pollutimonas bauzanensis]|uniref:Uncharacterized protein n=1 Tax=Pollutimonas bauzanensis TaxID=658167 RepID=A0A1M5YIX1_9BURK|nr:hypothetical protein [Pollutimonas bauzanensis]SHI11884.1 hypothetical protein SAMN04488135_109131 [Pollutimonas bauzanensis]
MNPTHHDFTSALEYLASIEPDPATYVEMDEYDTIMAPYEAEIQKAHATIRAYGEQIAPQGLDHMHAVLYGFLQEQSDPMVESVMRTTVNALWNGCGLWRG